MVLSGGGLHCYWPLGASIRKDQWTPIAVKLKALTHSLKLLADNSRTSDIASILRPVGTHNWKPEYGGKEVTLHYEAQPIAIELFSQLIDSAYTKYCGIGYLPLFKVERLGAKINDPETLENIARVKSALAVLDPNCDRSLWRDICWAVRSLEWSCGEELARSWSMGDLHE